MKKKVMLIDDFPESCGKVISALQSICNFTVIADPAEALERSDINHYDAFLVDINMPGMTGDKVIECLRRKVQPPTTFCLMTGADFDTNITKYHSYIVDEFFNKSGPSTEIESRFSAVMTRVHSMYRVAAAGPIRVNLETTMVTINEERVDLTSTEYRLLCNLISESLKKDYVPRDIFIQNIWGNIKVEERTLSTHLSNLNKRLEPYKIKVKTKRFKGLYLDY